MTLKRKAVRKQKNSEPITLSVNAQDLIIQNEQLKAEIAQLRQVKQELHDSEERFRAIFENSAEGILLISQKGKIFAANPTAS